MSKTLESKKIAVLMSGGVDSSVAALLLKQQGHDVIGITMQITADKSAANKAKKICAQLDIEHFLIDLVDDFKNIVLHYFKTQYENGKTPNPCVICNQKIKFEKMFEFAKSLGAELIATGHYAILESNNDKIYLKKSENLKKDQSYFLSRVSEDILKHTLFPLGNFSKDKVRELADSFNLASKSDKDSQDICFLSDTNYKDFLENDLKIQVKQGNIIDENGKILGKHNGIHNYTIGQRKGLGAFGEPKVVRNIDADTGDITLVNKDKAYFGSAVIENLNFYQAFDEFKNSDNLTVKVRYTQNETKLQKMILSDGGCEIFFADPQKAVSKGQFAVCYYENILLFSGEIKSAKS